MSSNEAGWLWLLARQASKVLRGSAARKAFSTVGAGAGLLPSAIHIVSQSHGTATRLLVGNIAVVSVVAAWVIIAHARSSHGHVSLAPWLACGALVGAGLIGPLRLAPYVLVAVLAFGVLAVANHIGGWRKLLLRGAALAAVALINFGCMWPYTLGRYRPAAQAPYLSLDLRAHTLLADVPLHDVWTAHLPGAGDGRTLLDVNESMAAGVTGDVTVALAAAIAAYSVLARVLGLATEECVDTSASVARRLTEADRARSIYRPGQHGFVYHFGTEALLEIQTCTVHATYVFAIEAESGGYALYWAAYARRVSWVTPYYMGLIDPVRRLVVYPSTLQLIEHRWRMTHTK